MKANIMKAYNRAKQYDLAQCPPAFPLLVSCLLMSTCTSLGKSLQSWNKSVTSQLSKRGIPYGFTNEEWCWCGRWGL